MVEVTGWRGSRGKERPRRHKKKHPQEENLMRVTEDVQEILHQPGETRRTLAIILAREEMAKRHPGIFGGPEEVPGLLRSGGCPPGLLQEFQELRLSFE